MKQAEAANADLNNPPKQPRQPEVEVVPDKKSDAPIDDATQDDLGKRWKSKGHKVSELSAFLFENFNGIEDLSQLKKSQVAKFEEFVQ